MTIEAPIDVPATAAPPNSLLTSPILPTLLKLAVPNTVAMFGAALVAVAETSYIGRLGTVPLAAIALVFPFTMLTQMMSAGAMGGGVSSAISRALGAGNHDRAAILALHAAMIGVCGGIFFTAMMLLFGRSFFSALGGYGGVLDEACSYSNVLFSGAIGIWLVNTLASVVRGTGDMKIPSATLIGVAACQISGGRHARTRTVRRASIRNGRCRRGPTRGLHVRHCFPDLVSRQRQEPAQFEFFGVPV